MLVLLAVGVIERAMHMHGGQTLLCFCCYSMPCSTNASQTMQCSAVHVLPLSHARWGQGRGLTLLLLSASTTTPDMSPPGICSSNSSSSALSCMGILCANLIAASPAALALQHNRAVPTGGMRVSNRQPCLHSNAARASQSPMQQLLTAVASLLPTMFHTHLWQRHSPARHAPLCTPGFEVNGVAACCSHLDQHLTGLPATRTSCSAADVQSAVWGRAGC